MATALRPHSIVLFVGDIVFLVFALWLSLYLRTFSLPDQATFVTHLVPFLIVFAVSVAVFFIAGLYENRSIILARRAFSMTLLVAQIFNVAFAAILFFLTPIFGIAPKTILLIYLLVSFVLILAWRVLIFPRLGLQRPEQAIAVGSRDELVQLVDALSRAPYAPARVAEVLDPASPTIVEDIRAAVATHHARFIIADFSDPAVLRGFPDLYNFFQKGIRFFDAMELYETVFGRVPLSAVTDRWLARNLSTHSRAWYDTLKRAMDIVIATFVGIVSLIAYPFIIVAIKLEDRGSIFVGLDRIGEYNTIIHIYKFRSMSGNDNGQYGRTGATTLTITKVGRILRILRLDELPQLWNVIRGDVSLIGPRPEYPQLVELYAKEIPYYNMRHLVKPGLSGWAQLYHDNHPHHAAAVDATREKLSYDLYYLKHRSLTLDIVIALKTIKKLLTRSGV